MGGEISHQRGGRAKDAGCGAVDSSGRCRSIGMGLGSVPGYPVVQAWELEPELFSVPSFGPPWELPVEVGRKLELGLAVLPLQLFALITVAYHR